MRELDRFQGCLIGGAAGDALGYAVEFMHEDQIFSLFGENGITEYSLRNGVALISDDTQMTLFTAAGLLAGSGAEGWPDAFRTAYLDWLDTQERRYPLPAGRGSSWLAGVPELFSPRAPGITCLSALRSGSCGTVERPLNRSKGCGGVMRVGPIGLFFNDRGLDAGTVARIGADAAAVTHGHTLGWMSAAACAQIIHEISQNDETVLNAVLRALDTAKEIWPETPERNSFVTLMEKAVDLAAVAAGSTDDLAAIHRLGEGWVGDEALAIAVYCSLKYADDFDSALIAAVNHKGDSDSTGAVAGNILGAKLGLKGIPEKYVRNLELKDVILDVAEDLWRGNPAPGRKYAGTNG